MRLLLYCIAGLVADWLLYVVWAALPLRADELGATPLQLGLLMASSSAVYVTMSIVLGAAADRVPRSILARIGTLLMIGACVLIPVADSAWHLIALAPLVGLAGSFFWPAIQAAVGSEAMAGRLERDIGFFNVSWSVGKALGFLTGGALMHRWGFSNALLAAAAGAALVFFVHPLRDPRVGTRSVLDDQADPRLRLAFLRLSWISNFAIYGVGAAIGSQCVKWIKSLGAVDHDLFYGRFLGAIFAAQTAAFVVLGVTRAWTYKRWPIVASQLVLAAACFALPVLPAPWMLLALAPVIGVGLGVGYAASIFYSLHTPAGHGRYAGFHEAIIGASNFLVPLVAGALASAFDLRWPYWLSGLLCLAVLAAGHAVFRATSTTSAKESTT